MPLNAEKSELRSLFQKISISRARLEDNERGAKRACAFVFLSGCLTLATTGCTFGFGITDFGDRTNYDAGVDGGKILGDAGRSDAGGIGPEDDGGFVVLADAGTPDLNLRFAEQSISLPGSVTFPIHHRGRSASVYAFTLHNPAEVGVEIRSLELIPSEYPQDLPAFTLEGPQGNTILPPNGELELAIRFSPQGGFPHGAKLVIGNAGDDIEVDIDVPVGRAMAVLGGQNGYRVVVNLEPPFLPSTSVRSFAEPQVDWAAIFDGTAQNDAGTPDAGAPVDAGAVDEDGGNIDLDAGQADAASQPSDGGNSDPDGGQTDAGMQTATDAGATAFDANQLGDGGDDVDAGDGGDDGDGGTGSRLGSASTLLRNDVDTQMRTSVGEGRIFVFGAADPALGPRARLMWSVDGLSWKKCVSRQPSDSMALQNKLDEVATGCSLPEQVSPLRGVAAGNGVIVALSTHESLVSSDGVTFTRAAGTIFSSTAADPAPVVEGLEYANGYFMAYGGSRTAVSTDGETWTSETNHPFQITAATYGNGTWLIVGENEGRNVSLNNAVTWEESSVSPEGSIVFTDTAHTGQEFVALTSLRTWRSEDGQVWERRSNQGRPKGLCDLPGGDEVIFVEVTSSTLDESSRLSVYRSAEPLGPVPGQSSPFYSSDFPSDLSYAVGCGDVLYTR